MRITCPNCKKFYMVDDEYAGYTVSCPACGFETYAKATPTRRPPAAVQKPAEDKGPVALCFFLGFVFSLLGAVIAALIDGRRGTINALVGLVVGAIVWVLCVYLFIFL